MQLISVIRVFVATKNKVLVRKATYQQ